MEVDTSFYDLLSFKLLGLAHLIISYPNYLYWKSAELFYKLVRPSYIFLNFPNINL